MNGSNYIDNLFIEVINIVNQFRTHVGNIYDKEMVEIFLKWFFNNFGSIVSMIEESKDLSNEPRL